MKTKKNPEVKIADCGLSPITKEQFYQAGSNFDPIFVKTEDHAQKEIEYLIKSIRRSVKTELQISAIHRFMALIKGGIFDFMLSRKHLKTMHTGFYAALTSTKSELIIEMCFLLGQIAPRIGSDFDKVGDYLKPLSFKIGDEVQIISDCCKYAFLSIIENCPSPVFFNKIYDIILEKGPKQKSVMSECLCVILQLWPMTLVDELMKKIVAILNKLLLNEGSPVIRKYSKIAACTLTQIYPDQEESFFGCLPDKLRLSIQDEEPMEQKERLVIFHSLSPPQVSVQPKENLQKAKKPNSKNERRVTFAPGILKNPKNQNQSNDENEDEPQYFTSANDTKDDIPQKETVNSNIQEFKESIKKLTQQLDKENEVEKPKIKLRPAQINWKPYEIKKPPHIVKKGNFLERNAPKDVSIDESKHLDERQKVLLMKKIEQEKREKLIKKQKKKLEKKENDENLPNVTEEEEEKEEDIPKIQKIENLKKKSFLQRCGPKETTVDQSKHIKDSDKSRLKDVIKKQKKIDNDLKKAEKKTDSPPIDEIKKYAKMIDEFRSPPKFTHKIDKSPKKSKPKPKKVPIIHMEGGLENDYLVSIQDALHDIPDNCTISIPEFLFCCSHNSEVIASNAITMLADLYDRVSFNNDLADLVDILLKNTENKKPKIQSVSLFALNEMPNHFDSIYLLQICCEQDPSYQLVKFAYTLLNSIDIEKLDFNLIKHLCSLAFKCYNTKPIKSTHVSGFVIKKLADFSFESVIEFGNGLTDNELREFRDFATMYAKNLTFRNIKIEIPPFNDKKVIEWQRKIEDIIQKATFDDWNLMKIPLFNELNKALLSFSEVDRTLRLIQSVFSFYGISEYQYLLPGLITNKCHISDDILTDIVENSKDDIEDFIFNLQPFVEDEAFAQNALKIQLAVFKRIASYNKDSLFNCIDKITYSLNISIQSQKIEVRQASVLCYVELFAIFGKSEMINYISTLPKASRDIILVVCAKKNVL